MVEVLKGYMMGNIYWEDTIYEGESLSEAKKVGANFYQDGTIIKVSLIVNGDYDNMLVLDIEKRKWTK